MAIHNTEALMRVADAVNAYLEAEAGDADEDELETLKQDYQSEMKELARLEKAEPQATVTQIQAVSLDDSDDEESNPAADAADGEISDDPDADDEMADDASSSDKTMADDAASSSSDKILVEDGSEEIFDDAHEAINEMVDEASSDQDIADEASHSAEEDIADDASSSSEEILTLDDFHECLDACRSGIDELHDQIQDHGAQISDEAMAIVMDMLEERINDLEQIFHEHEDVEWEINHLRQELLCAKFARDIRR